MRGVCMLAAAIAAAVVVAVTAHASNEADVMATRPRAIPSVKL